MTVCPAQLAMHWRQFFLILLLFEVELRRCDLLSSDKIIVSVAIDAGSLEIKREALRLFESLNRYGGQLRNSRKAVCVSHDGIFTDDQLLSDLKRVNVSIYHFSKRYSFPQMAPTLNKMCSFNPPGLEDDEYILYLDADVFIAADPLPLLSTYAPLNFSELLCGRPWNVFPNMMEFSNYIGENVYTPFFDYAPLDMIAESGLTYYGLCNSGVYFMRGAVARNLLGMSMQYLEKSMTDHHFRHTIPYAPSYIGIDTVILWAAQYALQYHVTIFSPRLNYMAAVEDTLRRYVDTHEERARSARALRFSQHITYNNGSVSDTSTAKFDPTTSSNFDQNSGDVLSPILIHFSRGSDLRFVKEGNTGQCLISVSTRMVPHSSFEPPDSAGGSTANSVSEDSGSSLVLDFVKSNMMTGSVCESFEEVLRIYDDTTRKESAPHSHNTEAASSQNNLYVYRLVSVSDTSLEPAADVLPLLEYKDGCCGLTLPSLPRISDQQALSIWIMAEIHLNCDMCADVVFENEATRSADNGPGDMHALPTVSSHSGDLSHVESLLVSISFDNGGSMALEHIGTNQKFDTFVHGKKQFTLDEIKRIFTASSGGNSAAVSTQEECDDIRCENESMFNNGSTWSLPAFCSDVSIPLSVMVLLSKASEESKEEVDNIVRFDVRARFNLNFVLEICRDIV